MISKPQVITEANRIQKNAEYVAGLCHTNI